MPEMVKIALGAGVGLLAIFFFRLSIDLFRRGTDDISAGRGIGFGLNAWRRGELPNSVDTSNWRIMKGLHVQVTKDGLDYRSKSTASPELF